MTPEAPPRPPYPGLRAFRRSETELFFGRDDCINAMVDRLAKTRFLAVLGSSGTGKSSLVKAGLLDALELGLMARAGSHWRIAEFRPEDSPLRNLARQLLHVQEPDVVHTDADVELLRTFLARGPRSVVEWCRAGGVVKGENLLLLVDQFEELFRYQDYAGREEAEAFAALLIESAHSDGTPIYVTLTMRSEYLGACSLFDGLAEEINAGMYLTPRMTREQCREAIVGPARVGDIEVEEALVNTLLNDLASFAPWDQGDVRDSDNTQLDRLVRRADQLPLLQYTLNRMWLVARERQGAGKVRLALADYKGLTHALNEHADQIFHQLDAAGHPVETVFRTLTSGANVADAVRQPTSFGRLVEICNGNEAGVRNVVDAYRAPECNFLLPEVDPQKPLGAATVIDISHESLIRQWRRLSGWLTKEALAAQQWRRLNDRFSVGEPLHGRELANMIAWRREVKPNAAWARRYGGDFSAVQSFLIKSEQIEARRRWFRNGAVAAIFLILLSATGIAGYEWHVAKRNLDQALAEQKQAQEEKQRAENNYAIAKDVLGSLTLNFAERAASDMPISEVTDLFQRAKKTLDLLTAADPNDTEMLSIHARVLEQFVDVYDRTGGYYDLALQAADEATGLFRRLAERQPDNTRWWGLLESSLSKRGDAKLKITPKDLPGARSDYEEAARIDRDLAQREPENEDHPRQLAIELVRIGDLQLGAKDVAGAEKSYAEALDIWNKLTQQYSILSVYHRDAATTRMRLAGLKARNGDGKGAVAEYQEALRVEKEILNLPYGKTPDNTADVARTLALIGDEQTVLGESDNARKSYDDELRYDKIVAQDQPGSADAQRRIYKVLFKIATLQIKTNEIAQAHQSYVDAYAAVQRLAELALEQYRSDASASNRETLIDAYGVAAWSGVLAGKADEGAEFAERILKFDKSQVWIDINRADAYLALGRYDDAKAIYLTHRDTPLGGDGSQTYATTIASDLRTMRAVGIAVGDIDRLAKDIGIAL